MSAVEPSPSFEVNQPQNFFENILERKVEIIALSIIVGLAVFASAGFSWAVYSFASILAGPIGYLVATNILNQVFPEEDILQDDGFRADYLSVIRSRLERLPEIEDLTQGIIESKLAFWRQLPGGEEYLLQEEIRDLSQEEQARRFPDWLLNICDLSEIETLEVHLHGAQRIPRELGYFTSLRHLSIVDDSVVSFQGDVGPICDKLPNTFFLIAANVTVSFDFSSDPRWNDNGRVFYRLYS